MKSYRPNSHRRRSIRLRAYNYTQAGAYFVTMCTHQKECVFGEIIGDAMCENACGQIVVEEWLRTAEIRRAVELDAFMVMPNHVHGIIVLLDTGGVGATRRVAPTKAGPSSGSIGAIIGQFKSIVTKRINELRQTPATPLWQRNYYERIIRNERELDAIRQYIANNPLQWALDMENPATHR